MSRQSSSRNAGLTDLQLRRLRVENTGGQPSAYQREGDIAAPIPGDEDAPFVKVPPFPSSVELWRGQAVIPLLATTAYETLPELSIGQTRLITTWFRYTSASNTGVLSIIAAVGDYEGDLFPIGVVNPTPTNIAFPALPFTGPAVSRVVSASEFRTQTVTNGVSTRFTLVWDVGQYNRFTLLVGDLAGQGQTAGSLAVGYSFSE